MGGEAREEEVVVRYGVGDLVVVFSWVGFLRGWGEGGVRGVSRDRSLGGEHTMGA